MPRNVKGWGEKFDRAPAGYVFPALMSMFFASFFFSVAAIPFLLVQLIEPINSHLNIQVSDVKNFLKNMVRISPSQVRLAPGERQIVKLAIRKPKDLAEQEYRSHLAFKDRKSVV